MTAAALPSPTRPGVAARVPVHRTPRDWLVDVSAFVLAVGLGLLFVFGDKHSATPPSDTLLEVDVAAGLLCCGALWWRRRWPLAVALAMVPAAVFSSMSSTAAMIAMFCCAVRCRTLVALAVGAANLATVPLYLLLRGGNPGHSDFWVVLGVASVLTGAVLGWGMLVRSRREHLNSLRERAVRAETEQQLRVDQARRMERTQIAREMHDVLAHRISLVSLHAGALEFRPDAPPDEIAMAAGVIRASAHEALKELREVIGVLREGPIDEPERPQPGLDDVPELIDQSREAGIRVHYSCVVASPESMPASAGRTVYRVVQEALTNARKHAPGAEVTVSIGGGPGTGVWIEVRNPAPLVPATAGVPDDVPGAGVGLVGLAERMELAGGRLEHGFTAGRGFRLRAEVPWQQ